jgi:hypothetical protein
VNTSTIDRVAPVKKIALHGDLPVRKLKELDAYPIVPKNCLAASGSGALPNPAKTSTMACRLSVTGISEFRSSIADWVSPLEHYTHFRTQFSG